MARKGYGYAESRWKLQTNSYVAMVHGLKHLSKFGSQPLVVPEDVITPNKPGEKWQTFFTFKSTSHNEHNTAHDVRTTIGNHFKARKFIDYDLTLVGAPRPWRKCDCEEHDNCCHTSEHKMAWRRKKLCACMLLRDYNTLSDNDKIIMDIYYTTLTADRQLMPV